MGSLAFNQAEPFGMVSEVFLGRDQRIKCMHETLVANAATHLVRNSGGLAVARIPRRPKRIERRHPKRLAQFERGAMTDVQIPDV
jgi:hypothetical protein